MIYCINSCTISNVSLSTIVPHNIQVTGTATPYSTTTMTLHWQTKAPVYSILGMSASAAILLLLTLAVMLTILFEKGTFAMKSKRKRRRKSEPKMKTV